MKALTRFTKFRPFLAYSSICWALIVCFASFGSETGQKSSPSRSDSSCETQLDAPVVFSKQRLDLISDLTLRAKIEALQDQRDQKRASSEPQNTSLDAIGAVEGFLKTNEDPSKDPETNLFNSLILQADPNIGSVRIYTETDSFIVMKVSGSDLPEALLDHIGAHRQVANLSAGEGGESSNDRNKFDLVYDHILLIAKKDGFLRFAGQYRQVLLTPAIQSGDMSEVASSEVLDYVPEKLAKLPPIIELGRSMIVSEYTGHTSLKLLWDGLAHYLLEHTEVMYLTGLVSISSDFSHLSRTLLYHFYLTEFFDTESGLADTFDSTHKFVPLLPKESPYISSLLEPVFNETKPLKKVKILESLIHEIEGPKTINPLLAMYPIFMNVKYTTSVVDPDFGSTDFFISLFIPDLNPARAKRMGDPDLLQEVKDSRVSQ